MDGVGVQSQFSTVGIPGYSPATGTLFVPDSDNRVVRAVSVPGTAVATVAGSGQGASVDGAGTAASFTGPVAVAVTADGTRLLVATMENDSVSVINLATGAVAQFGFARRRARRGVPQASPSSAATSAEIEQGLGSSRKPPSSEARWTSVM
jgi:DNA-binding beta-propeller fold protein YncE